MKKANKKNKEGRQASSQQPKALSMTRNRSTERGPSGGRNHSISKSRSNKNVKCYNYGKKGHVKKECWKNKQRRDNEVESSNAHDCTVSTFDDGKILYSETVILAEDRKHLADIWLIDLGAT